MLLEPSDLGVEALQSVGVVLLQEQQVFLGTVQLILHGNVGRRHWSILLRHSSSPRHLTNAAERQHYLCGPVLDCFPYSDIWDGLWLNGVTGQPILILF